MKIRKPQNVLNTTKLNVRASKMICCYQHRREEERGVYLSCPQRWWLSGLPSTWAFAIVILALSLLTEIVITCQMLRRPHFYFCKQLSKKRACKSFSWYYFVCQNTSSNVPGLCTFMCSLLGIFQQQDYLLTLRILSVTCKCSNFLKCP